MFPYFVCLVMLGSWFNAFFFRLHRCKDSLKTSRRSIPINVISKSWKLCATGASLRSRKPTLSRHVEKKLLLISFGNTLFWQSPVWPPFSLFDSLNRSNLCFSFYPLRNLRRCFIRSCRDRTVWHNIDFSYLRNVSRSVKTRQRWFTRLSCCLDCTPHSNQTAVGVSLGNPYHVLRRTLVPPPHSNKNLVNCELTYIAALACFIGLKSVDKTFYLLLASQNSIWVRVIACFPILFTVYVFLSNTS